MRVYLGWSGKRGQAVATALERWLAPAKANLTLWTADAGLDGAAVSIVDLHDGLATTDLALLCVTIEDRNEPWFLYQAGACRQANARAGERGVVLFLLDLEPDDLSAALARCDAVGASRHGVTTLVARLCPPNDVDGVLGRYHALEIELDRVRQMESRRSSRDDLGEILSLLRERTSDGPVRGQTGAATPVVAASDDLANLSLDWNHPSSSTPIELTASGSAASLFDFAAPTELEPVAAAPSRAAEVVSPRVPAAVATIDRETLRTHLDGERRKLKEWATTTQSSDLNELLSALEEERVDELRAIVRRTYRKLLARGEPIAADLNRGFDNLVSTLHQAGL